MSKRVLICYLTYSGNTEEVAELIETNLLSDNFYVDMYEIGFDKIPKISNYDAILIGTFTWDYGETPEEVKDFVLDVGYKPDNVFIFGTGDTQFGGNDFFCRATDRLCRFYNSKLEPLKIEQSPRGYQEKFVNRWVDKVINLIKNK